MKPLNFESPQVATPEALHTKEMLPTVETVANHLQVLLMPIAYQTKHPEESVDMSNGECKSKVVLEWIHKYAGPFWEYIESPEHKEDTINLNDPESLRSFFDQFEKDPETLH